MRLRRPFDKPVLSKVEGLRANGFSEMTLGRFLILAFLGGSVSAAAPAAALQLNPARQEVSLSPGETATVQIEAVNETAAAARVGVSVKNWFLLSENAHIAVEDWLRADKEEFTLKPGEKQVVRFTITAPAAGKKGAAASGFLVGMASFMQDPAESGGVSFIMSASIYVLIKGTEKPDGTLDDLTLRREGESLQALALLKNTGNLHLRPTGDIRFFNNKGQELGVIPIEESRPVYPGQTRAFGGRTPWPAWGKGPFRALARVNFWDKTVEIERRFRIKKKTTIEMIKP